VFGNGNLLEFRSASDAGVGAISGSVGLLVEFKLLRRSVKSEGRFGC
jgi:hypothetical protein